MTRRDLVKGLIAVAPAVALPGCGALDSASYRFRMTVEADAPEGPRTGSAVMEVSAQRQPKLMSEERPLLTGLKGEAFAIDLPSGPVFVLLKLGDGEFETLEEAVTYALKPEIRPGGWKPFWKAVNDLDGWFGGTKAELPRENWPLMVRFSDIEDSTSVALVHPQSIGVGRILLETTSDEVTRGIQQRLPWLRHEGRSLDPSGGIDFSGNPPLAKRLRQRDFKAGDWT